MRAHAPKRSAGGIPQRESPGAVPRNVRAVAVLVPSPRVVRISGTSNVATEEPTADPSRQTNLNKCETAGSGDETAEPDSDGPELPSVDDAFWSFVEECYDLADLPVATEEGTKIREDYVDETLENWESDPLYYCGRCETTWAPRSRSKIDHVTIEHGDVLANSSLSPADAADAWIREKRVTGQRVKDVDAVPWVIAVQKLLESHERTLQTTINLRYGWPRDPEFDEFSFSATDRWSPDYQREMYGQCNGWLRELTGGTRPSGGETEASFDNPHVALITRSASSVPDGERIGPVDHAANLRDPWREVYQKLRYTLESCGFSKDDYQYWRVLEPHPGDGLNRGYAHEHIILVVDGELSQSDLAPVMETHVSATEGAGLDAHTNAPCPEHAGGNPWDAAVGECDDCDSPISVTDPENVENLAAYVADYASIDPLDLFEREPSYIAWAAAMTAGNVRSVSRSDPAGWAATADRCKQRHESGKSDLEGQHGDRLTVSNKGTNTLECAVCGSPHGIDQDQTLTEHRLDRADQGDETVVADGGDTELWKDWVAAWRAGRKRTVVKECTHPDASNQCPLCDEYRHIEDKHAVDASVPIDPDAYVPDDAFKNEMETHVQTIEQRLQRNPEISTAGLKGMLHGQLPDRHTDALIAGVLAGYERPDLDNLDDDDLPDWRNRQRIPEWYVHSITVDGEEFAASVGNGVTMTEVTTASDTWDSTRGVSEEWREDPFADPSCNECESGVYELMETFKKDEKFFSRFECDTCEDSTLS